MTRRCLRIVEGGQADRPRSAFGPDDTNPARGIALGVMLALPMWCALAGLAWWAWASGVSR